MIRPEAYTHIFVSIPYIITILIMIFGTAIDQNRVISIKKHIYVTWYVIYMCFGMIWATGVFGVFNGIVEGADRLVWSYLFCAVFGLTYINKIKDRAKI